MALPTTGDVPALGTLKEGIDPLLQWAPPWLHDAIWAVLVYVLALVVLGALVRVVMPWLGKALPRFVDGVLNLLGMLLVLPEYVVTTAIQRASRQVPNAVFGYGDAVQVVVTTTQRVSRSSLAAMTQLHSASKKLLAVGVLALFLAWNGLYCGDRGPTCHTPTSVWADSVSAWFDSR